MVWVIAQIVFRAFTPGRIPAPVLGGTVYKAALMPGRIASMRSITALT